ncbi:MAG: DUF1499 domain-containing protein [bacterium]|nr:DUF1499 domain-containing protein [bacterium]
MIFLVLVGPVGSVLGILGPGLGFGLFLSAVALSAVSVIGLSGAAAFASATDRPWRKQALRASLVPFLIVLPVVLFSQTGAGPAINDVSTDLEDRPQILPDVGAAPGSSAKPPEVLELFANQQRESYPDIRPLILQSPPTEAFPRALAVAREMPSWKVVGHNEAAGRIEAIATSSVFRFVDDIVVRVRPDGSGTRVDLRSRSRMGRSDFGANAARILDYLSALQSR